MNDEAWRYYRDKQTGDYLLVRKKPHKKHAKLHEALAPEVDGKPKSLAWTMVSAEYLRLDCEAVDEALVPDDWMEWLDRRWEAAS